MDEYWEKFLGHPIPPHLWNITMQIFGDISTSARFGTILRSYISSISREICNIIFSIGNESPALLELFKKFIHFGSCIPKGLFINDVINFGGYRDPPPPPRHHLSLFGYPPPHYARNSRHNWFRDKTVYVGLLTTFEGTSQPGTASPATLNVTILSFGKSKHIYSFTVRVEMAWS